MRPRMDAAGAVDAENAPTAPWKTAQHAVSHSAHTHYSLTRPAHEIPDTPAVRRSSGPTTYDLRLTTYGSRPTTHDLRRRPMTNDEDQRPTTKTNDHDRVTWA